MSFLLFIYLLNKCQVPAWYLIWARGYYSKYRFFFLSSQQSLQDHSYPHLLVEETETQGGERTFPSSDSRALSIQETLTEFLPCLRMGTRGIAGSESHPHLKTLMGYWLYLHISVIPLIVKVPENLVHVVRERLPLPSNCLSQGVAFFLVCRTGPAQGWATRSISLQSPELPSTERQCVWFVSQAPSHLVHCRVLQWHVQVAAFTGLSCFIRILSLEIQSSFNSPASAENKWNRNATPPYKR